MGLKPGGTSMSDRAKTVVRLNTEQVQGQGDCALFDKLFAEDFRDHTPQPGFGTDKAAVLRLYQAMRVAFHDFAALIHWQSVEDGLVTTFKTYHGTHTGTFLGVPHIGKHVSFETLDAMLVLMGGSLSIGEWPIFSRPCGKSVRLDRFRNGRKSCLAAQFASGSFH